MTSSDLSYRRRGRDQHSRPSSRRSSSGSAYRNWKKQTDGWKTPLEVSSSGSAYQNWKEQTDGWKTPLEVPNDSPYYHEQLEEASVVEELVVFTLTVRIFIAQITIYCLLFGALLLMITLDGICHLASVVMIWSGLLR